MSLATNNQVLIGKRLIKALLPLVLVIWLAWLLAQTVWLIWKGPESHGVGELPVITASSSQNAESALSQAQVTRWELFGPAVAVEAPKVNPENAPQTRLRLELLGVFQHSDQQAASAIIAEQGKDGALFRTGDKLPGNATLEEVYPDRVILNRLGQRESLLLKSSELKDGIAEVGAEEKSTKRERRPRSVSSPTTVLAPRVDEDLSLQRQQAISFLALSPAEGGGYEIGAGAPAAQLEMVGVRPGDVILSVNGNTLGSETADMAALQQFKESGVASIVVQRGQQQFTVNYPP